MKKIFSSAMIGPITLILAYLIFLLIVRGNAPTPAQIVADFASLYHRLGYEVIFAGAFLEALVVVNVFVPGASAVALGAVFARSGEVNLILAILVALAGAMAGYVLDFTLGYFGFSEMIEKLGYGSFIDKAKQQIKGSNLKSFSLGFIHPDIGSFVALTAGTLKMQFFSFLGLSVLATLFWYTFWGILIFAIGETFLVVLTKYSLLIVLLIVAIWGLTIWKEKFV